MTERDIVERLAELSDFYLKRPVTTNAKSMTDMGPIEAQTVVDYATDAAAEITRLREMVTWMPTSDLAERGEGDNHYIYIATDHGGVHFATWCAGHVTAAEYHASTKEYLGHSVQDAWAFYSTSDGHMFERDDAGNWATTCYRLDEKGAATDDSYTVTATAWMEAMRPLPPPPKETT